MKITCERTFPFKVVGSCPKPAAFSWSCPTNSGGKIITWSGPALHILYVDSTNQLLVSGDGFLYEVYDFSGPVPVNVGQIDTNPVTSNYADGNIFDSVNNQLLVYGREDATPFLWFISATGTVLSGSGVLPGAPTGVDGNFVELNGPGPRRFALFLAPSLVYLIDPVARTIVASRNLGAELPGLLSDGDMVYSCVNNRLIVGAGSLPFAKFLALNPTTLATTDTWTSSTYGSFGFDYVASTAKLWHVGPTVGLGAGFYVVDPVTHAIEGSVDLGDAANTTLDHLYNWKLDSVILATQGNSFSTGGAIFYMDVHTKTIKCEVVRNEWTSGLYPFHLAVSRSDGVVYVATTGGFDEAISQIQF